MCYSHNKQNEMCYSHNCYSIIEVLLGMSGIDEFPKRDQDEELELAAAILHFFNNNCIQIECKLLYRALSKQHAH